VFVACCCSGGVGGAGAGYEEFELPSATGEGAGGRDSPDSIPEPERPPLRHIDKYIRAECPCLSKRYTIAVLTCIGKSRFVQSTRENHQKATLQMTESGQLYHVTTPSFGSQPISEGKSWIPTNQVCEIQKDR